MDFRVILYLKFEIHPNDLTLADRFYSFIEGIYSFVDRQGMLDARLVRPNDKIHLGDRGIARLVRYIKVCVYTREKYEKHFISKSQKDQESTPSPQAGQSRPT